MQVHYSTSIFTTFCESIKTFLHFQDKEISQNLSNSSKYQLEAKHSYSNQQNMLVLASQIYLSEQVNVSGWF
jgi:hypothetical protein